jgi:hypothetical protein
MHQCRALLHADHAEPSLPLRRLQQGLYIAAYAVILHNRQNMITAAFEEHAKPLCLGMLENIGERFLHNAIQHGFKVGGESLAGKTSAMEVYRDPEALRPILDIVLQHCLYPFLVQVRGAQVPGQTVHPLLDLGCQRLELRDV